MQDDEDEQEQVTDVASLEAESPEEPAGYTALGPEIELLDEAAAEDVGEAEEEATQLDSTSPENQNFTGPAPGPPSAQPSHYWTWRLLTSGYTPDECAAIRGLDDEVVLDHALRAIENGWPVRSEWFLSPALFQSIAQLVAAMPDNRLRPLLNHLPPGTRYEHLLLYVKCNRQN